MSELDKNEFTRGESSINYNDNADKTTKSVSGSLGGLEDNAFSVRSNEKGEWRATLKERREVREREVRKHEGRKRERREHEARKYGARDFEIKNPFWKSLGFALVATQAITSVLFLISLITTNIINGRLIFLIGGILLVLLILSAIKLLGRKDASLPVKIVCGLMSLLAIVGSVFALRYTDAINGFLNKVTDKTPETKQYSVVVNENSEIQKLSDLKNKSVGFLKTDEKAGNAENFLQEKVKFEADFYDNLDTLTSVLSGNIVDAITIETDRMEILKEEAMEAVEKTKVIYTFEIEIAAENAEIITKQVTKEPFVLYISGSDSRSGIKTTARSDVNILAVVNPEKGKILLVSIPRDMYVQLHGTTGIRDKLTHAGVYGINMSRDTIEDFLGIDIDYTVKVSFDTVVKVVDELGGIEIDSDTAMSLVAEGGKKTCKYEVGKQVVDGDCALRFARERKSYQSGDKHRGENQMQLITAIVDKLSSSRDYVLRLPEILNIAADSFETSLTRDDISAFIRMQLNDGVSWQVESISVNGTSSMQGTYSMGASRPLYVVIPSAESVAAINAKIQEYLK